MYRNFNGTRRWDMHISLACCSVSRSYSTPSSNNFGISGCKFPSCFGHHYNANWRASQWCREHDDKCEEIAKNAVNFYNKFLKEESILDFLSETINDFETKEVFPIYEQYKYTFPKKTNNIKSFTPNFKREYAHFKSLSLLLRDFDMSKFKSIKTDNNISILSYKNLQIVRKKVKSPHEPFIGLNCVNKLCELSSNFMWSYTFDGEYMYSEWIDGIQFQEWLLNRFNFRDYILILVQICLSLHISQETYDFCHFDLLFSFVIPICHIHFHFHLYFSVILDCSSPSFPPFVV